jgi:transposase InsO family protein
VKERRDDESGKGPAETSQVVHEKSSGRLADKKSLQRYRKVRFMIGGRGSRGTDGRGRLTLPSDPTTFMYYLSIRQQEGWCHEAIAAYLNQTENINISSGSAYQILKHNHLITKPYKPRKRRTYIRFARQHPDSLWQTDIKYYGQQYLIAFLDDCSRYIPAATLSPEATTDQVLDTLENALTNGRPQSRSYPTMARNTGASTAQEDSQTSAPSME